MENVVVLIPALNPDKRLPKFLVDLKEQGFEKIIVINDGSGPEFQEIFDEAEKLDGVVVAVHPKNLGKGAALKTGVRTAMERYGEGNSYVTADADGQHLPKDVRAVAEAVEKNPGKLVLGTRDFSGDNVPFKSRAGNRITSVFFRLTGGGKCPDTQTGLRGIPATLEQLALTEEGDRYEYEMNFLSDAAGTAGLAFVPIETVYEDGNKASHFRPVRDSARVYGRFLRFIASSVCGAVVDLGLYYILFMIFPFSLTVSVVMAVVIARLCSGGVNFLLNRKWSFRSQNKASGDAVRYAILFFCQMAASAFFTALLTNYVMPKMASKIVTDVCLFFISYRIQQNWVFRKKSES